MLSPFLLSHNGRRFPQWPRLFQLTDTQWILSRYNRRTYTCLHYLGVSCKSYKYLRERNSSNNKCLLSFHQLSLSLFIVKGITVIEMHKCWLDLIERENGEETLWNPTIKRRNNSPSYDGYLKDETPKVLLSVHLTDFVGWPLDPPPGHVTSLNPRSCTNSLQKN